MRAKIWGKRFMGTGAVLALFTGYEWVAIALLFSSMAYLMWRRVYD